MTRDLGALDFVVGLLIGFCVAVLIMAREVHIAKSTASEALACEAVQTWECP